MEYVSIISIILSIVALVIAYAKWQHPKTADRPEILVDVEWKASSGKEFYARLSIKNVGRATAYDVVFKHDRYFELPKLRSDVPAKTLDDIKHLKDGISGLEPGDEKTEIVLDGKTAIFLNEKQRRNKMERCIKIKVKYRGIKKRIWRCKQTFTIDFYKGPDT